MKLAEINPYIRRAMRSVLPPLWQINQRIILDYELILIESGCVQLTYNHNTYLCKQGDVLLLCPNVPHTFCSPTGVSQPHIHFDLQYDILSEQVFICFRDFPDLAPHERLLIRQNVLSQYLSSPLLKICNMADFSEHFYRIIDSQNHHSLSCKASMLTLLEAIMTDNSLDLFLEKPQLPSIAIQVKEYLDVNYCQNISLSALEKQFSYSKFYIEKCFKKETGLSVIAYRNQKRMVAAVELLGKHSVSETGQLLGYSSIYAFSQAFSRHYGKSPTEYMATTLDNTRHLLDNGK